MRSHLRSGFLLIAIVGLGASDIFQYEATVPADAKGRTGTAWLWIPPEVPRIRGLLLGGMQDFVQSDEVRAACASVGVGILVGPQPEVGEDLAITGLERLEAALADLAAQSGHAELTKAAFLPYGWSAGTVWSSRFAFALPERCFAAMTFKGGFCVPGDGTDTTRVSLLPWLHIQGQFEEFGPGPSGVLRDHEDRSTGWNLANHRHTAFRAANPDLLIGLVVDAGATHMGWNPRLYPLVAAFIAGAARLRISDDGSLRPVALTEGVLMDRELTAPRHAIAPAGTYAGPPGEAHWYPDLSLAEGAAALHRGIAKAPQYVTILDGKGNPQDVGHDLRFKWTPAFNGPDTFPVVPGFNTAFVPKKYPPQEGPLTHAEGPVLASATNGCLEQVDATTFRLGYSPRRGQGWVKVHHPGDDTFRFCEQIVMPRISPPKEGAIQAIAFTAPAAITAAELPLTLAATATSGLPVRFCVRSGPARLAEGNRLELADVPAGAPRPLLIRVTAWQAGSMVAPVVAAAEPVTVEIRVKEAP